MKFFKIFIYSLIFFLIIFSLFLFEDFLYIKNLQNSNFNIHKIESVVVLTGSKGRINEALKFAKFPNVKFIIISGANPLSSRKNILSHYKKYKLFFPKIIIERFSKNTIENAIEVKKILINKKLRNALIITSVTHIKRSEYIFKKIFENENITLFFHYVKEKVTLVKVIKERLKFMFDFFKCMFY